jgi:drug/metabolite transporter (DMT)-like permease
MAEQSEDIGKIVSPHPDKPALIPTLAAALAAILGASAAVATRFVLPESDGLSVAFLRTSGSTFVVLAIALASVRLRYQLKDLPIVLGLGLMQFTGFAFLFHAAFQYVPAARGALVLSTMPILTLALAVLVGRERLSAMKLVGGLLALGGVAIALGDRAAAQGPDVWKGDALMFAAAALGAIYNVLAGLMLRTYNAVALTTLQVTVGSSALFLILCWRGDFSGITGISAPGWVAMLYLMTVGGIVPSLLWNWSLGRIAPSRAAITVTINPIFATLLAALVLSEPVTTRLFIGLVGVVAGIALANWPHRSPR